MIFNSIDFAIFLPIVFILFWVFTKTVKERNILIVLSSYLFYGWWDWRFLSLILFSTVLDYSIGIGLSKQTVPKKRLVLIWISVFVNLGFLGFFKYFNFFLDSFVTAFSFFGTEINSPTLNIILPIGISFYTFQTLSYTIDIYRKDIEANRNFIAFAAYVCFFPQLVAGPIERPGNLLPQFLKQKKLKFINFQFGIIRILWGLFKKVVIADRLSVMVNEVYNSPENYGGIHYLIATVLFAFQIYCDFSGYSDIAIGTARMFDFKLMENFKTPYFSSSLTEFWRRWHISLSTWFRDYIYIPLGGNKVSKSRIYFNIFIIFLISGFWHGAKWTFIIWGVLHGLFMVLDAITKNRFLFFSKENKLVYWLKILSVFLLTSFAWIFFRANTTKDAFLIVSNLLDFSQPLVTNIRGQQLYMDLPFWKLLVNFSLIVFLLTVEYLIRFNKLKESTIIQKKIVYRWSLYLALILCILIFGSFEISQFIYFQF